MKTQSTTLKNNKAREAFTQHIGDARELVTLIARHLDEHMEIAPEEVNWANAGSAGHLVEELKQIARFLNLVNEEK